MTEQDEKVNPRKSSGHSFLRGTLILAVAGMIVKVIGSLNWIILSRVLGGEGIGLYQMAFPLYLLALQVSAAGIPVAISIITAEKIAKHDYHGATRVFRSSFIILSISGLVLSLVLFFGAHWLISHRIIRDPRAYYSLLALSPAIFFVTILSSFRGYLQGCQMMTPTAISQIVEQLFRVGAMLVFASLLLPQGLEFAAGGASLGAAAGAVAGLVVLIYYYCQLKNNQQTASAPLSHASESTIAMMGRITVLALPVSLSSILLPLVANLDLFIVPLRLEDAGYSVEQATELFGYLTGMAVPLVNLATIFTAALATSVVPVIAAAAAIGDTGSIRQRTSSAIRLTYLVSLPCAILLHLLAEPISSIIYNAPAASPSVQILSAAVFFLGIHQVTTAVLQGLGHTFIPVINMGLSAFIKVALNWTLTAVPHLGIQGAAWATVADIGLAALLNVYWIWRIADFNFNIPTLLKTLLAAAMMGAAIIFTTSLLAHTVIDALISPIIVLTTGILVYSICLLILGAVSEYDLARIPVAGDFLTKLLGKIRIR